MKKADLEWLIRELEMKKERLEETARQHRDDMKEAEGAAGEVQVLIWKLEEKLK